MSFTFKNTDECVACKSSDVTVRTSREKLDNGIEVLLSYCFCNTCGYEFVPPETIRRNDREVHLAKLKSSDTDHDFKDVMEKNITMAAGIISTASDTFYAYPKDLTEPRVIVTGIVRSYFDKTVHYVCLSPEMQQTTPFSGFVVKPSQFLEYFDSVYIK